MDCSLPGSSIHEILQARILEWVAIFFSRGSFPPRDRTGVSCIAGRLFTIWPINNLLQSHSEVDLKSQKGHVGIGLAQTHVYGITVAIQQWLGWDSCPLLFLSSIFPSIRIFSSESVLRIKWPKYWSFSFSISPSSEHSGLISFRMDWLDLLAVQGTLKSLRQHHSSKA